MTERPGGRAALLIIDMINRLDFAGADALRPAAEAAGERILDLREQASASGVPVIYVNDNHGDWHGDRAVIVERATGDDSPGRELARRLRPRDEDLFVMKPQFSGFYTTTLPAILPRLGVSRLVLTGVAADICVLFTAADAHMREYELWVPADGVASEDPQRTRWALDTMAKSMGANVRPTSERSLGDWLARA
ncbi:MAG: cysteine hydrolase [Sphingomonas bacterium]|nr:cysteine hydrolase [Sphingomonas bacterium]